MTDNIKKFLADSDLLLNAVGEGIYGFDQTGDAVFINPAAEKMTGWQSSELLGKNIHQYHHHKFFFLVWVDRPIFIIPLHIT